MSTTFQDAAEESLWIREQMRNSHVSADEAAQRADDALERHRQAKRFIDDTEEWVDQLDREETE